MSSIAPVGHVRVPRLAARGSIDEALAALAARGLVARVPGWPTVGSAAYPPTVVGSRPAAGTRVAAGSTVRLRLAPTPLGMQDCTPGLRALPDLVALPLGEAARALDDAGFAWNTTRLTALRPDVGRTAYLDGYVVLAQTPTPGTRERCRTHVRLAVRPAPAAGRSLVPRLQRTTVDRALLALRRAGLGAAIGPMPWVTDMADVVVRATRPAAGRAVPRGSTVALAITFGLIGSPVCPFPDDPPPVPDVVGLTLADVDRLTRWSVDGGLPALPPDPERTSYYGSFSVTAQSPAAGSPGLPCGGSVLELAVTPSGPA